MTTRFYFENISEPEKAALDNYFHEKKVGRLEKLLHGNFELAKFVTNAKYHKRHDFYIVRLGLSFAKNDLAAEEKGHLLTEAFDLSLDRIVSQLRKSKGKLRDK